MNAPQFSAALSKEVARLLATEPHSDVVRRTSAVSVVSGPRGDRWEVLVTVADDLVTITVAGEGAGSRRALRNALVGRAALRLDPREHHVLAHEPVRAGGRRRDVAAIASLAVRWVRWLDGAVQRTPFAGTQGGALLSNEAAVYWWDERANFGDAVGPWLVRQISGREPVNARRRPDLKPALYGVGSILGLIDRPDVDVWGAGLMEPLSGAKLDNLARRRDVRVHAVRGHRTREDLIEKLGWEVPEVYGDPALLLPRFYTPQASKRAERTEVAVVPHYVHKAHFAGRGGAGVDVVDVAQDLEGVIDQIATADACVSTSLHGAIIAQAYGVPWVWLRVEDQPLGGDRFKFADFFSTLDEPTVATYDTRVDEIRDLDLHALARKAILPELRISLDALLAAFPLVPAPGAGEAFALPPLPQRRRPLVAWVRSRLGVVKRRLRQLTAPSSH